jgi:hypothetical protein
MQVVVVDASLFVLVMSSPNAAVSHALSLLRANNADPNHLFVMVRFPMIGIYAESWPAVGGATAVRLSAADFFSALAAFFPAPEVIEVTFQRNEYAFAPFLETHMNQQTLVALAQGAATLPARIIFNHLDPVMLPSPMFQILFQPGAQATELVFDVADVSGHADSLVRLFVNGVSLVPRNARDIPIFINLGEHSTLAAQREVARGIADGISTVEVKLGGYFEEMSGAMLTAFASETAPDRIVFEPGDDFWDTYELYRGIAFFARVALQQPFRQFVAWEGYEEVDSFLLSSVSQFVEEDLPETEVARELEVHPWGAARIHGGAGVCELVALSAGTAPLLVSALP